MSGQSRRLLISHSSLDGELAEKLASVIRRCSLRTIDVWHSSDESADSGLAPGQRWFDTIRENLQKSDAVILLMTPNSVRSSWVLFEAGFGAGVSNLEIMPLVLGVDIYQVPNPLSQWQIYRTNAPEAVMTFLRKLFGRLNVHFDDDLVRSIVFEFAKHCESHTFNESQKKHSKEDSMQALTSLVKKKFQELNKNISRIQARNPDHDPVIGDGFDLAIQNKMTDDFITVFIDDRSTVGDVYNKIYNQISRSVKPWTYLSSWILRDVDTGQIIVIREVSHEIPARFIFRQDRSLEIIPLDSPYSGADSEQIAETYD